MRSRRTGTTSISGSAPRLADRESAQDAGGRVEHLGGLLRAGLGNGCLLVAPLPGRYPLRQHREEPRLLLAEVLQWADGQIEDVPRSAQVGYFVLFC